MVEAMVEWFFENYEDPAQSVPHDSSEGGYQYIGGGPYEARDVLFEQFDDASENDIEEAVLKIDSCGGPDWVKISDYSFVDDYEEDNFGIRDGESPPDGPHSPF